MRQWLAESVARRVVVFMLGVLVALVGWTTRYYEDLYGHGYNFEIWSEGSTSKVYNQGDPTVLFEGTWDEAVAYTEQKMDEGDNLLFYNLVIAGGAVLAALSFLPGPRQSEGDAPTPTDTSREPQQGTPTRRWLPATIAGRLVLFVTGLVIAAIGLIVRDFLYTYRMDDPATGYIFIAGGAIMMIVALIPFHLHGRNGE